MGLETQSRLVSNCMVATDPLRFLERPEEARNGTQKLNPDIHRLGGGASFSVPQGYRKVYVTVWPVVELGWVRLIGPPLHIGPYAPEVEGLETSRPEGMDDALVRAIPTLACSDFNSCQRWG